MKPQDIHTLIERFLNAETTLQEERLLMEYFRQKDIPEELMPYRDMFLDYEALATADLPAESDYIAAPDAAITTVELSRKKHPPRLLLWAVAASIAVLMVIGGGLLYNNNGEQPPVIAKISQEPAAVQEAKHQPEEVPAAPAAAPSRSLNCGPADARRQAAPQPTLPPTPQVEDYEETTTSAGILLPAVTVTHKSMANMTAYEYMDEFVATNTSNLANHQISTAEFNALIREKGMAMASRIQTIISE